jgi:hypothetical protein
MPYGITAWIHGHPLGPLDDIVIHRAQYGDLVKPDANHLFGGLKREGKERNYFLGSFIVFCHSLKTVPNFSNNIAKS